MAEDTDILYRKRIYFRRDLRLAARRGVISYGNRSQIQGAVIQNGRKIQAVYIVSASASARKSHTNTKSRQRVSFTTDLSEQSKESSSLLLREKGDRADFHGVEYRVVDEELLCVMDTSSVIATLASPSRDATFPYWGRQ